MTAIRLRNLVDLGKRIEGRRELLSIFSYNCYK
jgi:hypothetical protein